MKIRIKGIRITKSKRLKKAVDRTKLVLVDTLVKGKNKVYYAKRWKNPSQAMNILEKTILSKKGYKKGGGIVYKDKKAGIIVSREEVMKNFLEARRNPNQNINKFIQKNYNLTLYKNKNSNDFQLMQKICNTETSTEDRTDNDSLSKYTDKNGKLSLQREKLHQEIILKHFKGLKPANSDKTFVILGGGSASGKSTVVNSGLIEIPEDAVKMDADNIKGMLPEYNEMIKAGNGAAARYAHEESSALVKRIQSITLELGYNALLDGTGDGSPGSLSKKINQGKKNGYKIVGEYVTIPTELALERADARAKKSGRKIDQNVIIGIHKKVSQRATEFAKDFDEIRVYENIDKPTLIAKGGGGKPLKALKGFERNLKDFIKKGES